MVLSFHLAIRINKAAKLHLYTHNRQDLGVYPSPGTHIEEIYLDHGDVVAQRWIAHYLSQVGPSIFPPRIVLWLHK